MSTFHENVVIFRLAYPRWLDNNTNMSHNTQLEATWLLKHGPTLNIWTFISVLGVWLRCWDGFVITPATTTLTQSQTHRTCIKVFG